MLESRGQEVFDVERDGKNKAGTGSPGQGTDDDDAKRLFAVFFLDFVEIFDGRVEDVHVSGTNRRVEGKARNRTHLTRAFGERLAVEDGIDRKPLVARVRVDVQIFPHRKTRRRLDRMDKRIGLANFAQLVDVGVEYGKPDVASLGFGDEA